MDEEWDRTIPKEEELDEAELEAIMRHQPRPRGRKKHNNKSPEVMAIRRRKIWVMMSKKELGKVQRAKTNNHKEMLISCKKVAQHCMKYWRQKAMQVKYNLSYYYTLLFLYCYHMQNNFIVTKKYERNYLESKKVDKGNAILLEKI